MDYGVSLGVFFHMQEMNYGMLLSPNILVKGGAPVKSWTMFVIAIGCLLIATSPQLPSSNLYLGVGVVLAAGGAIRLYVTRKK